MLGGPEHGRGVLAPTTAVRRSSRRYRDDTLILESVFQTDDGSVRMIDFMPPRGVAPDIVADRGRPRRGRAHALRARDSLRLRQDRPLGAPRRRHPLKDFTPIILVAWSPLVLVTNPSLSVSSVKELIEYVRARPGAVNYATGGRGDGSHLAALFFNKLSSIDPVAVPFQGEGPALPSVLGNQVPYMFLSAPTAAGAVGDGQLKGLAVTSKKRASILPEIPTMQEAGLPAYEMVNWWGFFGPAGMAPATVDSLNKAITEVLQEPAIREKLNGLGYEIMGSTPQEFRTYVESENIKWAEVIKSQGLSPN